jgi:hypothetical protein
MASALVMVKHLSPDVTIAAIAEAFRVYAQVIYGIFYFHRLGVMRLTPEGVSFHSIVD